MPPPRPLLLEKEKGRGSGPQRCGQFRGSPLGPSSLVNAGGGKLPSRGRAPVRWQGPAAGARQEAAALALGIREF